MTATTADDAPAVRRDSVLWVVAIVAIVAGAIGRLWISLGPLGVLNADEVVSGLMARALLDGDASAFFWGQSYGGAAEVVPMAIVMAVAGGSVAMTVIPLLEWAVIAVLVHRLARRRLEPAAALAVVGLVAVFPASAVWFSTRPMLFYQPVIICGLVALLLTERLAERRRHWVEWVAFGVALGLGWWTSAQVAFFAVPAVYWLLTRRAVRSWRDAAAAVGGTVVGALPWLITRVRGTSGAALPEGDGSYADHLVAQLRRGWPMTFGARRPFDERWLIGGAGWVLALVCIAATVAVVVQFVRHRELRSPLAGVLLTFPLLQALAPTGSFVGNGRYYVFVVPSLAYAVVGSVTVVRRSGVVLAGLIGAAALLTAVALIDLRDVQFGPDHTGDVAAALDDLGVRHIYGDYWVVYPLAWADDDLVVAPDTTDRRADWSAEVRDAPRAAYVFWLPYGVDAARYERLRPLLERAGITEEVTVGEYRIIVPATNLAPESLPTG
ncbi:MAG TPA: glycosyltransferase family 39 protein [Ilumatobacteraceae bacterium]